MRPHVRATGPESRAALGSARTAAIYRYPFDMVRLSPLMESTAGIEDVVIGLIDGPVAVDHPDLAIENVRALPGEAGTCAVSGTSCIHGTFVAGMLLAHRTAEMAGICPGCTLLVRPIFFDASSSPSDVPAATSLELAEAIHDCIDSGARLVNVSAALSGSGRRGERRLAEALDRASRRGVVVVTAAGNQRTVGGSALNNHPWALPVVAYSRAYRPMHASNLGRAIGRQGLGAPGDGVVGLTPDGGKHELSGTSVAAPLVTGAAALIWSEAPSISGAAMRYLLTRSSRAWSRRIAPPLLDAWNAYRAAILALEGGS